MKSQSLHWLAIVIALFATFVAGREINSSLALFALALILCLAGLVQAANRCANALEKRN
jgi:hypothetical protein